MQTPGIRKWLLLNAVILQIVCPQIVEGAEAQTTGSHGPHIHGRAALTFAAQGTDLHVNLTSPAINLVGFEAGPISEEQHILIREVLRKLQEPGKILTIPGEICRVETAASHVIGFDEHSVHTHDGHAHSAQHDHSHAEDGHAEFHTRLAFRCRRTVTDFSVTLFEHFPAIEHISVQWVTDLDQGEAMLTHERNEVKLR